MGPCAQTRSRVLPISALLLPLLLPAIASAAWGDENWDAMVWGAGAPGLPAMAVGGVVAVVALLPGLSYWFYSAWRSRAECPRLYS